MASEYKTPADFTEPQVTWKEDKEASETLKDHFPDKYSDLPSPGLHREFPEGGLAAWATAFGS
jgi:hypothetical protein